MTTSQRLYSNAAELLNNLKNKGFNVVAPIDVNEIARHLDITVKSDISLQSRNAIGEISFHDEKPVVRINPIQNSYIPRKRFTLAHEIGHYCLHSGNEFTDSKKTMSRTESFWDSCESEANDFAAQLLMPRSLVIEEGQKIISHYTKNNESKRMPASKFIELMADKFEVSNKAMEYRLKNLKIIK